MQTDDSSSVLAHVGDNIRRLRIASGMSQASLAAKSGVSRRTMIKLEAGEANISLTGLDRLADALGATFVDLVAAPAAPRADINAVAWRGADEESVAILRSSVPAAAEAQLWSWSLGPGATYVAQPDPDGWSEIIVVLEGVLRIERATGATDLRVGDHLTFPTSQQYSYVNPGEVRTRFMRVVVS